MMIGEKCNIKRKMNGFDTGIVRHRGSSIINFKVVVEVIYKMPK